MTLIITPAPPLEKDDIVRIRRFVIRLGKTMHEYGTPAHRLERLLVDTTELLGMKGAFLASPTSMSFVFWEPGSDEEFTHVARVNPGGIDLNRLVRTHQLAEQVLARKISVSEGLEQLQRIHAMPGPYPAWANFFAWGITSAAFAALCGTGSHDVISALLGGWLVFFLVCMASRSSRIEEMLEPVSALLIAFIASGVAALGITINVPVVVLAGIIAFIPGLSLTIGLRELAARELISGTARIMDAAMVMFKLYFGAVFGLALGGLFWAIDPHTAAPVPMSPWASYLAVLALSTSLLVIFKVRPKDAFWALLAGMIAYLGAAFGNHYFSADMGGLVGALIVGLYANSYARIKNRPSSIVLLPGIVLLVPGSKVFIGMNSLISGQDMLTNAASGSQVFLSFMAIIAGLIFANVLMPPTHRV